MYAAAVASAPSGEIAYYVNHPDVDLGKECFADAVRLLIFFNGLEALTDGAETGALVIYSCKDRPQHAGILLPGRRVRSKWGMGYVWEHGLWEVPVSYGRQIAFFKAVSGGRILTGLLLLAWAKGTLPDYDWWKVKDVAAQLGIAFGKPIPGF
jgi:hypothetical protein